jgi:uncharacterized membrane protein
MIDVVLYSRADCHLCELARDELDRLQSEVPHKLVIIDIDSDPELQRQYGFNVPVIKAGPYKIEAPIEHQDLLITLRAAQHRERQIADIDAAIANGTLPIPVAWTKADKLSLWLTKHYLAIFNLFIFLYVGVPFLAPILMHVGAPTPAAWIYKAYSVVCHELAFRSWFLFGEQPAYPRESAGVKSLVPYGIATGLDENDLWGARSYQGTETIGYKVALCERDVAIYGGILIFGLMFALTKRKLRPLHWVLWVLIGLMPIGLDGLSQLLSQPPLNLLVYRESTPLLRTLTGFSFGFMTAWFGYPYVEETMRENYKILEDKRKRIQRISRHTG